MHASSAVDPIPFFFLSSPLATTLTHHPKRRNLALRKILIQSRLTPAPRFSLRLTTDRTLPSFRARPVHAPTFFSPPLATEVHSCAANASPLNPFLRFLHFFFFPALEGAYRPTLITPEPLSAISPWCHCADTLDSCRNEAFLILFAAVLSVNRNLLRASALEVRRFRERRWGLRGGQ